MKVNARKRFHTDHLGEQSKMEFCRVILAKSHVESRRIVESSIRKGQKKAHLRPTKIFIQNF